MALTSPRGFSGGPMADIDYGIGAAGTSVVEGGFDVSQPNAGTRTVSVAAGTADAFGIRITNDAAITQALAAPSSGGAWYLLALRFTWTGTGKGVALVAVAGPTTGVTTKPVSIPGAVPSDAKRSPGGQWDLPLAYVFVNSADTTATIFDLRMVRNGLNGAMAVNLSALVFSNLQGLFASGGIIPVGVFASTYGQFHEASAWQRRSDGTLVPLGRIKIGGTNNGADVLGELLALKQANLIGLYAKDEVFDSYTGKTWQWGGSSFVSRTPAQNDSSTSVATTEWVQTNSGVRVANLQALLSLLGSAQCPPVGTLVLVGQGEAGASGVGGTHYRSTWRVDGYQHASPLDNVPILVDSTDSLGRLTSAIGGGGYWAGNMSFSHRHTIVHVEQTTETFEYRWDANSGQFRLWPGSDTYCELSYNGGTDQQLNGNDWTTQTLFDTWDYQGLFGWDGSSLIIPAYGAGRYEFTWWASITNDDTAERYLQTVQNATRGVEDWTGHSGAFADRPMVAKAALFCNPGDKVQVKVNRSQSGAQWFRRGNYQYPNRPRLLARLIGWR